MDDETLDIMWTLAPPEKKIILATDFVVKVLQVAEGTHMIVNLDDGRYELVLNKLEEEAESSDKENI